MDDTVVIFDVSIDANFVGDEREEFDDDVDNCEEFDDGDDCDEFDDSDDCDICDEFDECDNCDDKICSGVFRFSMVTVISEPRVIVRFEGPCLFFI